MLVELLGSDGLARLREDSTADNLAQSRIWKTKDRALSHFRIRVESGLHLRTIDVLAAADDDVLQAVQNEDEATLHLCDVARVEEALRVDHLRCVLRPVLVALHIEVGLDAQLSSLAILHSLPACWVLDRCLNHKRDRLAAACGMFLVINSGIDTNSAHCLCETISLRRLGSV